MQNHLQTTPDEHLEARITAYILGEASPFEAAELESLIEKSPELKLFANRTRTLHSLLLEAETTANSHDPAWSLPGEKRLALAPILGPAPTLLPDPHKEHRIRRASYRAALGIAAVFLVTLFTKRFFYLQPTAIKETRTIVSYMSAPQPSIPGPRGMIQDRGELAADKQQINIGGQVRSTGPVEFKEGMTLSDAVADAGGATEFGSAKRIKVYRDGKAKTYDLTDPKLAKLELRPNDTIEIPQKNFMGCGASRDELVESNIQRKPASPSNSIAKVIAANTNSPTVIPVPDIDLAPPSSEFGDAADFGGGWGDGGGGRGEKKNESLAMNDQRSDSAGKRYMKRAEGSLLPEISEKDKNVNPITAGNRSGRTQEADPFSAPEAPSSLAQREVIRRQESVTEADKQFLNGREAYAKGDYEKAREQFDGALAKLPDSPAMRDRRDAYADHLAIASVADAQKMRKVGKYDEARALLEKATASGGGNQDEIKTELGYLDDPIRTNPTLTYEHTKNVDEVRRNLYKAQGNFDLGKYDEAKKEYENTLRIDPYNKAARRGMEKVSAAKSDYYRAAYDQSRAELLMQVDKAWELEVPAEAKAKEDESGVDLKSDAFAEKGKKQAEDIYGQARAGVDVGTSRFKMNLRTETQRQVQDQPNMTDLFNNERPSDWSGRLGTHTGYRYSGNDLSEHVTGFAYQNSDELDLYAENADSSTYDAYKQSDLKAAFDDGTTPKGQNSGMNFYIGGDFADSANSKPPAAFDGFVNYGAPFAGEPKQIKIKTKFVEVAQQNDKELGFDWIVSPFKSLEENAKQSDSDIRREAPLMSKFFSAGEDVGVVSRSGAASKIDVIREFTFPTEFEPPEIPADPIFDTSAIAKSDGEIEYEINRGYSSQYLFRGLELGSDANESDGVPLLGDIPGVGRLFRAKPINLADLSNEIPAAQEPFSTFSLNISDASFQVASSAVAKGERPDPASIKPEQFYNAVSYGDPAPSTGEPVAAAIGQLAHPVIPGRNLVRMSVRTAFTGRAASQPLVLTLLIDQSGSMARGDRRAAMDTALAQLATLLTPDDRVTVIGFSRTPRLIADSLSGDKANTLPDIINQSASEGGTNLEQAIQLAESLALRHKQAGAQNRIVLFTDGAANLGNADPERLAERVKNLRQQDLAFDIAGIGTDEINDRLLSELARHGDGRYYLVGEKTAANLAKQLAGAFRPAAENVKIQVKFNPQRVGSYKLIGFEKDRLKTEDFRNDSVDAAELAADESGTALYQVEPLPNGSGEIGELFVRFRDTATGEMVERSWTIPYESQAPSIDKAQPSMQLAALSLLAAQKLQPGPLADAINFRDLAPTIAAVKQAFARSPQAQQMITLINALK